MDIKNNIIFQRVKRNALSFWHAGNSDAFIIESILNLLPTAAVLFHRDTCEIVCGNTLALKMTAFTHNELENKPITNLFEGLILERLCGNPEPGNDPIPSTLLLRNGGQEPVIIQTHPVDKDQRQTVITFEYESQFRKKHKDASRNKQHMGLLIALGEALQNSKSEQTIKIVLDTAQITSGAQMLALYQVDPFQPILCLQEMVGNTLELQEYLPLSEVGRILKPEIWTRGKRIRNGLQRLARSENLSYLATCAIGDGQALLGLILAADRENPPDGNLLTVMQILSGFLTNFLQHNALVANLLRDREAQQEKMMVLQTIQENAQDGILLLSPQLKLLAINPSAELMLGYASHEVQDHPVENIVIGADNLNSTLSLAQEGIPTPTLGNIYLHRRDGQAFPAHVQIQPIKQDEDIKLILIFLRDLSEHQQIKIRTQQLEQRALLGEVMAIFAHEVRNPINNISMALQLMEMDHPTGDPNTEYVERMKADCERLTHLMDSVLSFSRTSDYRIEPMQLSILLERLIMRWKPRMSRVNVETRLTVAPNTPKIRGDEKSLEQVFNNLFSNALRAMSEAGGKLSVKLSPVRLQPGQTMVQIDVSDTGMGIPHENLEQIFNPFFTTDPQGTGLGLAITQRIILAHKGTIKPESFPGGGTVFTIQIPAISGQTGQLVMPETTQDGAPS